MTEENQKYQPEMRGYKTVELAIDETFFIKRNEAGAIVKGVSHAARGILRTIWCATKEIARQWKVRNDEITIGSCHAARRYSCYFCRRETDYTDDYEFQVGKQPVCVCCAKERGEGLLCGGDDVRRVLKRIDLERKGV